MHNRYIFDKTKAKVFSKSVLKCTQYEKIMCDNEKILSSSLGKTVTVVMPIELNGESGVLSSDIAVPKAALLPEPGNYDLQRHKPNQIGTEMEAADVNQTSQDQNQIQLHQKTQSLLIASSMMAGVICGVDLVAPQINNCAYESDETTANSTPLHGINTINVNIDELIRENYSLREKLKEVTHDRDRLLCEVSNLRLELDMSELKRLPEESFPQKVIDRPGPGQYAIAAPPSGSISSGTSSSGGGVVGGGSYVYLQQQQYSPCSASTNLSAAIINPSASHLTQQQQQQIVYQHHQQQYPMCHQQQLQQQSAIIAASGGIGVGAGTSCSSASSSASSQVTLSSSPAAAISGGIHHNHHNHNHHQHYHHHMHHGHHHGHHHGGAVVIAGSGVGTGVGVCGGGGSPSGIQQSLHKKNSVRGGGEVLKRSRAQTAYELSQDLLEKQIELLERKYGGVCARNAAITIQRAFRHYMMVKKFASITAMAKAEKRLSRRMMIVSGEDGPPSNTSSSSAYGSATESQIDHIGGGTPSHSQQQQQQPRVTIMAGPPGGVGGPASSCLSAGSGTSSATLTRTPPTRSMSLRERRHLDASPIPRSQSGASSSAASSSAASSSPLTTSSHPHVNLLHATEQHYYSGQTPGQQQQLYHYTGVQGTYHAIPHDVSFSSNSSHLDSSLNVSWVSAGGSHVSGTSPYTPYYSAAQIYMRPKALTPSDRKKVPPEVPKRTSSITAQQQAQQLAAQQHQQMMMMRQTPPPPSMMRSNGLCKTAENGSLTSVQSSGSDSSVTSADRIANCDLSSDRSNSPHTWKRGINLNSSNQFTHSPDHILMMASHPPSSAVIGVAGSDDHMSSHTSAAQYEQHDQQDQLNVASTTQNYKVSETIRKRQYRVGLNLFNKKPEKGITYLIRRGFLENTPQGVARFLISRKGLSRQMIGEYLGNLQNQFNMAVLDCFAGELDLSGMQVDVALRKFQAYFRMPGEAQKIERLMEIFSHRYCQCNQDIVGRLRSSDTIFVLAFAIIMLNTDLHTPNLKPERRMRVDDFIKNLRGIDDCHDIDRDMLSGVYERVKANEFKPGSDHVTQVMKVQATIVGKKPNLALPHRRLVCYCRLYEIPDVNKKERPGVHQREVFLFNDLLVITKIFSKKKSSVTYTFRNSFPLCGMVVTLLDVTNYPFCIQLSQKVDGKILVTFNARNEHDRCKFAEDLKESICEMDEMESLRIEAELERQKSARNRATGSSENRDSGVADVEVCPCPYQSPQGGDPSNGANETSQQLKRSALSNSLLDMHEQFGNEKPQRRGSVGSLDSGMSISFQSTAASSASRENAAVAAAAANAAAAKMRFPQAAAGGASVSAVASQVFPGPSHHHMLQGYHHPTLLLSHQQPQPQHLLQHQQQQQAQLTGRIPGRERKLSRSDESGRSTDV